MIQIVPFFHDVKFIFFILNFWGYFWSYVHRIGLRFGSDFLWVLVLVYVRRCIDHQLIRHSPHGHHEFEIFPTLFFIHRQERRSRVVSINTYNPQ